MLKVTSYVVFTLLMGLSVAYGAGQGVDENLRTEKRLERTQAKMLLKIMDKKGRVNKMDSQRANDYLTQTRSEALDDLKHREFTSISSLVSN